MNILDYKMNEFKEDYLLWFEISTSINPWLNYWDEGLSLLYVNLFSLAFSHWLL